MVRLALLATMLAVLLVAFASTPPQSPPSLASAPLRLADGRLPNILLLTIDTLRADHVGYSGNGPADLTPSLDGLAEGGTVFLSASTPAPTTRTATASLLTGTYRGSHLVFGNAWPLRPGVPVISEVLARAGYNNAAFLGNRILGAKFGFDRGFSSYKSFAKTKPRNLWTRGSWVSADEEGVAKAIAWLAEAPPEPWFLWLHLMDPHGPYVSAPLTVLAVTSRDETRPDRTLRKTNRNTGLGVLPRYQAISKIRQARVYRQRYRAGIRHMDAQAGKLLEALAERGERDDTLVILTADHGEGLGDHNYFFQHGWLADEGSVGIPLAFRLPGRVRAGMRLDVPVSLVDVAPTVLGGIGLEVPPSMQGRDLSPSLRSSQPKPLAVQPVFSASTMLSGITAVRLGPWKLVHVPGPLTEDLRKNDPWKPYYEPQESFRLFHIPTDPGEEKNRADESPERLARMKDLLSAWEIQQRLRNPAQFAAKPDAETIQLLRSLGYID